MIRDLNDETINSGLTETEKVFLEKNPIKFKDVMGWSDYSPAQLKILQLMSDDEFKKLDGDSILKSNVLKTRDYHHIFKGVKRTMYQGIGGLGADIPTWEILGEINRKLDLLLKEKEEKE